jgi:glyoxylase-like metal-dependent hydrolase (beta-lactamase superfamily II)
MLEVIDFEGVRVGRTTARLLATAIPYYLYFVDGLLIDTGPYSLRREIEPFLRELPIEQVALTHLHEDHCGLASRLASRGVPLYCSGECVGEAGVEPRLPLYRRLIWGHRPAFSAKPLPDVLCAGRRRFRVLRAPGHTPHHAAFYEPERGWLFTGDLYLTARPKVVFIEEDLSATIGTLEALAGLDVRVLFDTHAGPLPEGRRLLTEKRHYLEEIGRRVAELRRLGLSDEAIDRRLFPRRPAITYLSRGEWSSLQMVRTAPGREDVRP